MSVASSPASGMGRGLSEIAVQWNGRINIHLSVFQANCAASTRFKNDPMPFYEYVYSIFIELTKIKSSESFSLLLMESMYDQLVNYRKVISLMIL